MRVNIAFAVEDSRDFLGRKRKEGNQNTNLYDQIFENVGQNSLVRL